jgi:broad specificity phosphatase PhoE
MSRIYMIRHGKPASTWGDHVTDADPGLDVAGHEQARAVCEALMSLAPEHRPKTVVSSPLRRCRETAAPFARTLGRDLQIEEAVAEIPTPTNLPHEARGPWLRRAFAARWAEVEGDIDYALWRDRVAEAVARHDGAAIFTHFVAINAAVSAATGDDRVLSFQPGHASITVFEVEDGKLRLIERGRSAVTSVL